MKSVVMLKRRFSYFPLRFDLEGQIYDVSGVQRVWSDEAHIYFQVVAVNNCERDTFVLAQDVHAQTWRGRMIDAQKKQERET